MNRSLTAAILLLTLACTTSAYACGGNIRWINQALSDDPARAEAAVKLLRAEGPGALDEIVSLRDAAAAALATSTPETLDPLQQRKAKLDALIDQVGGARYCSVSRLYWYTNLEEAILEAQAVKKPVLSLRMLGQLTDEFSCANSRFFRTTLYSNQEIAKYLRENYVLHWQSVRPVPKITIDFGDGRKIERTITGNSAHYVLAPDGQCVEALPGLYGPKAFLSWLERAHGVANLYAQADVENRAWFLRKYHAAQRDAVMSAWQADLARVAPEVAVTTVATSQVTSDGKPPRAEAAAKLAVGKGRLEVPLLKAMTVNPKLLEQSIDDTLWEKIAGLHANEVQFDGDTLAIMRRETAAAAGARALTKRLVEDPLLKMVRNLTTSVALDSVRNEYLLHRQIHEWFAAGKTPSSVFDLNERVYAELFLTPSSDPWLGLVPADTYTALERGGVTK